jgi:flagellar FliL protein
MRFLRLALISLSSMAIIAVFPIGCQSGDETEAPQKVLREGPPPLEDPDYMSLGTFVVNMPDGKYYLKTTMSLAFTDSGPMEWMTGRIPLVKDMIIRHLQSISVEQLENLRYRQILKNDLMIRLNSLFPNEPPWEDLDPVKRILFTEFYKQ